jgi:transcriptional regulator with XRE-family HTH domain
LETFGERLRDLRKRRKLTQDQMGEEIGIHPRHLGKYEAMGVQPNADALVKIAKFFDVSLDYLFFGKGDPSEDIKDRELLGKMRDLDQLSEEDRKVVVSLIDAYLKKMQFEKMMAN